MRAHGTGGRSSLTTQRCRRLLCLPLLLTLLQIMCTGSTAQGATPQYGGTLTVAVDLEFRGFDPLNAGYLQFGDRSVVMAVEERLFSTDREGKLVPELALSATPSRDQKSWIVKLRGGVSFHDGTPFDADAVVQHWRRMLDPGNRYPGAIYLQPVAKVVKVDDLTVRFVLKHPWAPLRSMLSESQWMGAFIPSPKAVREKTQSRAPVGTGPFVFSEWIPNDRLVVLRNRSYWQKGRPYLDRVVFRPVADHASRFTALTSGNSDVILSDLGTELSRAKGDPALRVYSAESSGPYALIINTKASPLNDPRLRQALAYAWNQEAYLKSVSGGTIPVARDPFGGTLACADLSYRNHDAGKAKELLAAYGAPVALELLVPDTPRGRAAGEIVQGLFGEIGISLTVTRLPEAQLVQRVMRGEYQISGWRLMDLDDMGPYLDVTLQSGGKLNFTRYKNDAMDELLKIQQLSTDDGTRQDALCGVASLINRDVLYLYAGTRRFHLISRSAVQGIRGADHGIVRVADAWLQSEPTPPAGGTEPFPSAPRAARSATRPRR